MPNFKHFGVMLDMSRNAVMRVEEVKKIITLIKKMGYDTLGLYLEDTYEIAGEPYFGYLRGRYSVNELKEIDEFALKNGIEVIPHIQTLAHLNGLTRHREYSNIFDINEVLLIDEPKTYELIEKMFATMQKCFSSKNINIGMDEAFGVGRGKYLDKHGYQNRYELLTRHLNKVVDIAVKYGFKPHMWSDMFFRIACNDYVPTNIPDEVTQQVPEQVGLSFWDYYHKNKEFYDEMFKCHKTFDREVWFAGGAWSWFGFAPLAGQSFDTMQPALKSVIDNGIEHVMITMWGDCGRECSFYSLLHILYAIRQYGYGNFDLESIKKGFNQTFGLDFDSFMTLELPNHMTENFKMGTPITTARVILYQDLLLGVFDYNINNNPKIPYSVFAEQINCAKANAGEYAYIFDTLYKLCKVLDEKERLGINLRLAYKNKDKEQLKTLTGKIDGLVDLIKEFHTAFRYQWHKENKPQGFEVQDARLGGLILRLQTCKYRLESYLNCQIDKLEELEEEILSQLDGESLRSYSWSALVSNSRI